MQQRETRFRPFPLRWISVSQQLITVVLVLLGLSLGLNIWSLTTIYYTRAMAGEEVAALAEEVRRAQHEVVTAQIGLSQPVPIQARVPIRKQLNIPIDTTVQIDRTIDVSLGTITVPVPLNLKVPVRANVPVNIDETVDINTTIALDSQIPISIPISDTVVADYLDRLYHSLLILRNELGSS